ncbi:MAG: hypothetical protein IIC35_02015 [Gemmatimonadetes bacterium]|nr:hypothetical protein [Gemmatimonadota bacterium]
MELLTATGPWMYPLLAVGVCLLGTIVRAAIVIGVSAGVVPPSGPPHHSVIVCGVLGGVVGLLGTVVGFGKVAIGARAATGAELAQLEVMLGVMWDGVMIIVTPITLGLWIFTASLVAWLVLQFMLDRGAP